MKVLTVTTKFVTLVLSVGGQDNDVKYTIRRVLAISANEYTCKTRLSNQNSQIIFEKDCMSRFRGTSAGATMWSMVVNNNSKERTSTTSIYSFIYVKASSPPRLIPLLFLCYGTPLVF